MKSKAQEFLDKLKSDHVFVADGAMGTMLYNKGIFINRCFDELNLSSPELVADIHREYLSAGADIIETNTFAANRFKLAPHGFVRKLNEINIAGARIAKEVAGESAFVAGSVGPLGHPLQAVAQKNPEEAYKAFLEQIEALVEGGVDLIFVETMNDLDELTLAITAAKDISDLPVVGCATFTDDKTTIYGDTPEDVAKVITASGADVAGVNCSSGPKLVLECAEEMAKHTKLPLCTMPNAGSPQMVEGRYIYLSQPDYMAEYSKRFILKAGSQIVGGCCGTRPEHIKTIASAVRALRPAQRLITVTEPLEKVKLPAIEPLAVEKKSVFARKLRRKFSTSVELYPPKGTDARKVLKAAETLKEYGIDCVNIPDGPRAMARMSPMALAHLIESKLGMETILHYTCRDRNILGMQSDILGCHALELKNILCITGDPPKLGDYPDATSVFDLDSIGLVKMLHQLNCGEDLVGKAIGSQSAFHIGVGANPGAMNLDEEVNRFKRKVDEGADFVMTQPIFDVRLLENFIEKTKSHQIPMMIGVLPLVSHRNTEFLHNEVPGMVIPDATRKRMAEVTEEDATKVGTDIAREAVVLTREFEGVAGVYIMPPFGRYKMALKVLDLM